LTSSLLLTDVELSDLATDFLDALLASASTDVISPKTWWERAKSALETGAVASESFGQMAARCAKKLQIDAFSSKSSVTLAAINDQLRDPAAFEAFRSLCQRDAVYITALTRVIRTARNELRKAQND